MGLPCSRFVCMVCAAGSSLQPLHCSSGACLPPSYSSWQLITGVWRAADELCRVLTAHLSEQARQVSCSRSWQLGNREDFAARVPWDSFWACNGTDCSLRTPESSHYGCSLAIMTKTLVHSLAKYPGTVALAERQVHTLVQRFYDQHTTGFCEDCL